MDFKKKAGLALALAAIFTTGGATVASAANVTSTLSNGNNTATVDAGSLGAATVGAVLELGTAANPITVKSGEITVDGDMTGTFARTADIVTLNNVKVDVVNFNPGTKLYLTGDGSTVFKGNVGTIAVLANGVEFHLGTTDAQWATLQMGGKIPDILVGTKTPVGGLDTAETVAIEIENDTYTGETIHVMKTATLKDVLTLKITDGGALLLDGVDMTTTDRTKDATTSITVDSTGLFGVANWEVKGATNLGIDTVKTNNFITFIHDWAPDVDGGARADYLLAGTTFTGTLGLGTNQGITLGAPNHNFINSTLAHLQTGTSEYNGFGAFAENGVYRNILGIYTPQSIFLNGAYVVDATTNLDPIGAGPNNAQAVSGNVFFSDNSVFAVDAQMGSNAADEAILPVFTVSNAAVTGIAAGGTIYIGGNAGFTTGLVATDPAPRANNTAATFYAQNAAVGRSVTIMQNIADNGISVGYGDIKDDGTASLGTLGVDQAIQMVAGDPTKDSDEATRWLQNAMSNLGVWDYNSGTLVFSSDLLAGSFAVNVGTTDGTSSLLLNVTRNTLEVQDVYPLLSDSMAAAVDQLYGEDAGRRGLNNVHSDNAGIAFVSRATDNIYMPDHAQAANVLEGAAQIAVAAGAPAVTGNVITKVSSLIVDHNNLLNDTQPAYGNEPGAFGLWLNPFYGMSDVDGLDSGSFENGYEINYGGAAFGVDYNMNEAFRLGLALSVGGGDSESQGDFKNTDNSFDFFGVSLYGSYSNGAFGITGDVGYTAVDNDIEQDIPAAMAMGSQLDATVDSDAFTVGLTGQYRITTAGDFNIAPHLGMRYTKISTDDAKVKAGGAEVMTVGTEDQDLFQIPLGVEFSKAIATDSGWTITPSADLGVLFTVGDTDIESRARISGFGGVTALQSDVTDSAAFTGKLGVKAAADNGLSLGLDYGLLLSGNQTDHQFSGMLRFEF